MNINNIYEMHDTNILYSQYSQIRNKICNSHKIYIFKFVHALLNSEDYELRVNVALILQVVVGLKILLFYF